MTRAEARAERARRLDSAILDVRIALSNKAVTGERRALLQAEYTALRLVRVGVTPPHAAGHLRLAGIVPAGRRPPKLRRGPREWGGRTHAHLK